MFWILAIICFILWAGTEAYFKWQDLKRGDEVLGVKYEKREPTEEEISWFFGKEGK
jgi:hypothetical protein